MEIHLSLWESTRNRTASQQTCFFHLGPLQVSWQKQTNIWYWAETCPLALKPAVDQKRCSQCHIFPSRPYLSSSWPANKGIISLDFLQEGIGHRKLSTYRATLQLRLQLLRLCCLWITNHNAKRYTWRGTRPTVQLSHSEAWKKKMHLFLSEFLSRKRAGQMCLSNVPDICWAWHHFPPQERSEIQNRRHEDRCPSMKADLHQWEAEWHWMELQRKGFKAPELNLSEILISVK